MQRRLLLRSVMCTAGAWPLFNLHAAQWPDKPIKVTTPFAPGSSDLIVRKLGEYVGKSLGQALIVESKPGAQGTLATRSFVGSKPDGYSLLLGTNSTHSASKFLFKKLGYEPLEDFEPIIQFTSNPLLLVVSNQIPCKNFKEFISYAQSPKVELSFGAGNTGSLVAAEMLKKQAGFDAVAVNYQGNSQAVQDFMAGRLDFMVTDPLIVKPFIDSGKFKVLGITSKQRLPNFPDVAPLAEQGLPNFEYISWVGLFAPKGLRPEIAEQLHKEFAHALQQEDVQKFLTGIGMLPMHTTRAEFQGFLKDQVRVWEQLSRDAGLVAA